MTLMHYVMQLNDVMISHGPTSTIQKEDEEVVSLYGNGGGEGSKLGKQYALDLNFGELEFDWERGVVIARILGVDSTTTSGRSLLSASWTIDQLSGKEDMPGVMSVAEEQKIAYSATNADDDGWRCMAHRGDTDSLRFKLGSIALISWVSLMVVVPLLVVPLAGLAMLLYFMFRNMPRIKICFQGFRFAASAKEERKIKAKMN